MMIEQNCVILHNGREFRSGGAEITPDYAVAYLKFDSERVGSRGHVTTWHGDVIGEAWITARWCTRNGRASSHMFQIWVEIDGVVYTGRGAGSGFIWRGKRSTRQ